MHTRSDSPLFKGEIGMAMSGGGYRAAGFHLGAMGYLDSLGLREQLTQISTVSGGTFVGAAYTRSLVEKQPFDEFFRSFYGFLAGTNLVELGLRQLGKKTPDVPSGREDIIVAMARVYAKTFMAGADGQPFLFSSILDADIPLREVVFNATEFRTGIAFRFQRSENGAADIGNYYFDLPREMAGKIQVADIVAASSCFPGGFEPLAFPVDFAWPDGKVPEMPDSLATQFGRVATAAGIAYQRPLALMDGGVFDNQGLSSLMMADERAGRKLDPKPKLAMCIVSDADLNCPDLYRFPAKISLGIVGHLSLRWVNRLAWFASLVCLIAVLVSTYLWATRGAGGALDIFGYAIPILLAGMSGGAIWAARRAIGASLKDIPDSGGTGWVQIRRLTVEQFVNMMNLRVTSMMALTSDVFMKRIRSLVRDSAYEKGYRLKLVMNYIYDLRSGNKTGGDLVDDGVQPPTPGLQRVIDEAAGMKTALWFDDDKPFQLPCLVAAGQATLAYALMRWIKQRPKDDPVSYEALRSRLLEDWNSLNADPYALLQQRLGAQPALDPPPLKQSHSACDPPLPR